MDEKTKLRLEAALERKTTMEREIAEERKAAADREAADEAAKAETLAHWPRAFAQIEGAVRSVNKMLIGQGLAFEIGKLESKEKPALHHLAIYLRDASDKRQGDNLQPGVYLMLEEIGRVRVNFLIPHSGKSPPNFSLFDATEDFYSGLMAGLLEQFIESKAKKRK